MALSDLRYVVPHEHIGNMLINVDEQVDKLIINNIITIKGTIHQYIIQP